MVQIVAFDPETHRRQWEEFVVSSYNPSYVLLSPDFLRWQFLDNPANETGGYTLWLVLHKEAVVAQLGFVPFVGLSPEGERFSGAYPINLMVRPDYRAFGLGAVLLKKLVQDTACVLNPGSSEAGATLCVGLGMRDLGCLTRYVAIIDEGAAAPLALDGKLPAGATPARADTATGAVAAAGTLPDGAPARFSVPVAAYGAERSRAFMRWRYEGHPAFAYEFLLSPDLASVLVFHEERESSTGALVIRIVDFLAAERDQEALLDAVLAIARQRGAALADFFCSLRCYDDALKRGGFFDEGEHDGGRIAALFQPLDFRKTGIRTLVSHPAGPDAPAGDWYVAKGDSDQDRPNDKRIRRGG